MFRFCKSERRKGPSGGRIGTMPPAAREPSSARSSHEDETMLPSISGRPSTRTRCEPRTARGPCSVVHQFSGGVKLRAKSRTFFKNQPVMPLPQSRISPRRTPFLSRCHRQKRADLLKICQPMELSLFVRKLTLCAWLALATPGFLLAQANFSTNGGEVAIAGFLPGDQVHPGLSLSADGGFLVWDDNNSDADGQGISAIALDTNFSKVQSRFRVNQIGSGNQERPQVSLLNDGGAVFVWQGGPPGAQHISARFLSASNTWATGDVRVNTFAGNFQIKPVVA